MYIKFITKQDAYYFLENSGVAEWEWSGKSSGDGFAEWMWLNRDGADLDDYDRDLTLYLQYSGENPEEYGLKTIKKIWKCQDCRDDSCIKIQWKKPGNCDYAIDHGRGPDDHSSDFREIFTIDNTFYRQVIERTAGTREDGNSLGRPGPKCTEFARVTGLPVRSVGFHASLPEGKELPAATTAFYLALAISDDLWSKLKKISDDGF